jgi:hypothetical protein
MHPELSPKVARIMRDWEDEQRRKEKNNGQLPDCATPPNPNAA